MTQDHAELGARLASARAAAGVSRRNLAVAMGVAESTISRYERGMTKLTPEKFKSATRALGRVLSQDAA